MSFTTNTRQACHSLVTLRTRTGYGKHRDDQAVLEFFPSLSLISYQIQVEIQTNQPENQKIAWCHPQTKILVWDPKSFFSFSRLKLCPFGVPRYDSRCHLFYPWHLLRCYNHFFWGEMTHVHGSIWSCNLSHAAFDIWGCTSLAQGMMAVCASLTSKSLALPSPRRTMCGRDGPPVSWFSNTVRRWNGIFAHIR